MPRMHRLSLLRESFAKTWGSVGITGERIKNASSRWYNTHRMGRCLPPVATCSKQRRAIAVCNSNVLQPTESVSKKSKQLRHLNQTRRTMSTLLGTSTISSPTPSTTAGCTREREMESAREIRATLRCSSGQLLSGLITENRPPVIARGRRR